MSEGFSTPEYAEKKIEDVSSESSAVEKLIANRWETINSSLESFKEKEAEDSLNPERFMVEVTEDWEKRHGSSEHTIDTMSPFDRANFLLALLVEKGAEWSSQKRAVVRRATVGFIQQSIGSMTIQQQEVYNNTVLSDKDSLAKIGKPKEGEQKLITQWLQDTVGRGVK